RHTPQAWTRISNSPARGSGTGRCFAASGCPAPAKHIDSIEVPLIAVHRPCSRKTVHYSLPRTSTTEKPTAHHEGTKDSDFRTPGIAEHEENRKAYEIW